MLMDLYDKDILDEDGEKTSIKKCPDVFFERVTALLPIKIKDLNRDHMVRCLEVLVRRGLGAERLFRDYLLLQIERNIFKFSID